MIKQRKLVKKSQLVGARPVGYLQYVVELNSVRLKTNPSGGREKHLNPGNPNYKSSARPLGHSCLIVYATKSITFAHNNVKFSPIRQFALFNTRECFLNYKFSDCHVFAICCNGCIMSRLNFVNCILLSFVKSNSKWNLLIAKKILLWIQSLTKIFGTCISAAITWPFLMNAIYSGPPPPRQCCKVGSNERHYLQTLNKRGNGGIKTYFRASSYEKIKAIVSTICQ